MQRNDRWPTDYEPDPRSRRNSASSGSKKGKKSPPTPATSTPKRSVKPDLVVTGRQILKRPDRANSLPASSRRRLSLEAPKPHSAPPRRPVESQSSKSRETSLEDDMSLDLSQVSDFEDKNSKYGMRRCPPKATSTPKKRASLPATRDQREKGRDSRDSTKTSTYRAGPERRGVSTDLEYSSVSPEYSGPSSAEASPRQKALSQDISSCYVSTWLESDSDTKMDHGEWTRFWANYNGSSVPTGSACDQTTTPRGDTGLPDLDFSADGSRSQEATKHLNSIIQEGLHLTPRETENILKCAHILGNVLSKALERSTKEKQSTDKLVVLAENEKDLKKKTMTLDLKETHIPLDVKEEKRSETVTTQTDISLPNTRSAPKIFENILRQLSRSSIDEGLVKKAKDSLDLKVEAKE